jgi:hypothetical protein
MGVGDVKKQPVMKVRKKNWKEKIMYLRLKTRPHLSLSVVLLSCCTYCPHLEPMLLPSPFQHVAWT